MRDLEVQIGSSSLLHPIAGERVSSYPRQMTDRIESLLQGKIELPQQLEVLRATYENAKPFKHIVIENLFSDQLIERVANEIPSLKDDTWVLLNEDHLVKYNLRSAVYLGENSTQLTAFLHSATFLYLLSELTGIRELLPDPYLQGAGFHVLPKGGKFDVHVDRNVAYETGLIRRFALIIYLNKDWKHEYGGQLELWNSDGTRCEVIVEPTFNRSILFEISDLNYHRVPEVAAPNGRSRNSFLVYYHTAAINSSKTITPHTSIYGPSSNHGTEFSLRRMIKDITPPALWRGLKGLRQRE